MYDLRCIFFFFFGFIGLIGYTQETEFISGQLIDSITLEPVVFATVRIKDKALGVISNADGSFKIPVRFKSSGEYLEISSMGYETRVVSLSNFKNGLIELIKMKAALFELDEVVVSEKRTRKKELTAKQIIYKSIKNLSVNLPQKPYSYVGYYRDYQLKNDNYTNLNEAIFQIYDQGVKGSDFETSKVRILEYHSNNDFPIDTVGQRPYDYKNKTKTISKAFLDSYGGNEYTILRIHNPIRNYQINSFDFVNKLESDFADNHIFYKEDDVIVDGIVLYHISFKVMDDNITMDDKIDVKGHMYIMKDDFAIQGFDYVIYDKVAIGKNEGEKKILLKTKVEYIRQNGKMYLSYHSMDNAFKIAKEPKLKLENVILNLHRNCFILKFTNTLEESSALRKSNYNAKFNGEKIKIKRLVLIGNEVLLYPDLENENTLEMITEIKSLGEQQKINNKNLKLNLKKLKDIDGNIINENWYENRKQFREFFVQKLQLEIISLPTDSLYMDKRKPIFNKLQPINEGDSFKDYWMNTPLQNTKQ
ncbi:carboxypeptidase-like regulatory domain-containing protein [Maribacter arcticus]|uniref:carboxypeptidase-like regulatory domain-containing protein n=1 Tax=Maribacter arcticus TaxID=561365 RepID=UPI0030D73929